MASPVLHAARGECVRWFVFRRSPFAFTIDCPRANGASFTMNMNIRAAGRGLKQAWRLFIDREICRSLAHLMRLAKVQAVSAAYEHVNMCVQWKCKLLDITGCVRGLYSVVLPALCERVGEGTT